MTSTVEPNSAISDPGRTRLELATAWAEFAIAKCMLYTGVGWRDDVETWTSFMGARGEQSSDERTFLVDCMRFTIGDDVGSGESEDAALGASRTFEAVGCNATRKSRYSSDGDVDDLDESVARRWKRVRALSDNATTFREYWIANKIGDSPEYATMIEFAAHRCVRGEHNAVIPITPSEIVAAVTEYATIEPSEVASDVMCFVRNAADAWILGGLGNIDTAAFSAVVAADANRILARRERGVPPAPDPMAAMREELDLEKAKTAALSTSLDAANRRARDLGAMIDAMIAPEAGGVLSMVSARSTTTGKTIPSKLLIVSPPSSARSTSPLRDANRAEILRSVGKQTTEKRDSDDSGTLDDLTRATVKSRLEAIRRSAKPLGSRDGDEPFACPSDETFVESVSCVAAAVDARRTCSVEELSRAIGCIARTIGWLRWRATIAEGFDRVGTEAMSELVHVAAKLRAAVVDNAIRVTGDGVLSPSIQKASKKLARAIRAAGGRLVRPTKKM